MTVMSTRTSEPWVSLLAAVFRGAPSLPEAACRGRGELMDVPNGGHEDVARAVSLCHSCPCLTACREWADRQPRSHLAGVIGGRWYGGATKEKANETRTETK